MYQAAFPVVLWSQSVKDLLLPYWSLLFPVQQYRLLFWVSG